VADEIRSRVSHGRNLPGLGYAALETKCRVQAYCQVRVAKAHGHFALAASGVTLTTFWHPCQVGVHFCVHRRYCLLNPLCFNTLEMEPVAGFGRFSPLLQPKYACFYWVFKQKRFYPILSLLIRLVSVLVSVGVLARRAKRNQRHDSQYETRLGGALGRVLGLLGHLIFNGSPPGVFHPPELVNGGSDSKDPLRIIAQFLQRDTGEVLDGIGSWVAERFEQSPGNLDGNIMRIWSRSAPDASPGNEARALTCAPW